MKKTRKAGVGSKARDLRSEYTFDYARGRKNRFASSFSPQSVAVVLEPDVAQVFGTSRSVNRLLRSVIKAVPIAEPASRKRRKAG
jgi:hypothetical protein